MTEPVCPKCRGAMWNNIGTKKSPKQPDYRCKTRECDGVIWPPRDQQRPDLHSAPQPQQPAQAASVPQASTPKPLGPLYADCLDFARRACAFHFPDVEGSKLVAADVLAAAATLFIQATKTGAPVSIVKAKPAPAPAPRPAPPPPAPEPNFDDYPPGDPEEDLCPF